jgi:hypothetical protein
MKNLNLILKVQLSKSHETQVKGVSRVTIDGLGYMLVQNAENGLCERVKVSDVHSLGIVPIHISSAPVPIAHAA